MRVSVGERVVEYECGARLRAKVLSIEKVKEGARENGREGET